MKTTMTKRMHSKKASVEWKLMSLIIALLAFGALMAFLINFNKACQPIASDESCRQSLKAMNYVSNIVSSGKGATGTGWQRISQGSAQRVKTFPLACKYQEVLIKGKKKKEVIPHIRKLLDRCWYKIGEGKIAAFGTNTLIPDVQCFTCFTFKASDLQNTITETELRHDLMTKKSPSGETVWEYIHADSFKNNMEKHVFEGLPISQDIEGGEFYSVILVDVEASTVMNAFAGLDEMIGLDFPTRLGSSKMYITKTNDATQCYNDAWYIGDSRPMGEAGGRR